MVTLFHVRRVDRMPWNFYSMLHPPQWRQSGLQRTVALAHFAKEKKEKFNIAGQCDIFCPRKYWEISKSSNNIDE